MSRTERARQLLARYDRAVLDRSPMAAYARLHRIAPVALVAIGALALVGARTTPLRYQADPRPRIEKPAARHRYVALARELRRLNRRASRSAAQIHRQRALALRMRRLAASQRVPDCRVYRYRWLRRHGGRRYEVSCAGGSTFGDDDLVHDVNGALILGGMFLVGWLYYQLRAAWLLPRWAPRLWYTPVYAAVVALVVAGPYLMVAIARRRVDPDYPLDPSSDFGHPSVLLVLVALLQLTAVLVHVVMTNASTRLASRRLFEMLLDALARSARDTAKLRRLSATLLPAWGVLLLGAALPSGIGWLDAVLAGAGYLACAVHVLRSGAVELDLRRHLPATRAAAASARGASPSG